MFFTITVANFKKTISTKTIIYETITGLNSMQKVFVDVGISLDEFIAGPNGGTINPLGNGVRLFENISKEKLSLEIQEVINSPEVTHLVYKLNNVNRK